MKKNVLALAAVAVLTAPMAASAVPVTLHYDFTASGFVDSFNSGAVAPVDPVTVTFSVAFDNAMDIFNSAVGVSASSNLQLSSPLVFTYSSASDSLAIGGLDVGASGILVALNAFDWRLLFNGASTTPSFLQFNYAQGDGNAFLTNSGSFVPLTTVPEPGSLPLLGVALAVLGLMRRCRRAEVSTLTGANPLARAWSTP